MVSLFFRHLLLLPWVLKVLGYLMFHTLGLLFFLARDPPLLSLVVHSSCVTAGFALLVCNMLMLEFVEGLASFGWGL